MNRILIFSFCLLLVGCNTAPLNQRNANFDTVPWRWADYTNRVWVSVSGVGVEDGRSNSLKNVKFSYSPNTGKSANEAIAISSFNMFTGRRAEELLLKVLFGVEKIPRYSDLLSDGKVFHIYKCNTHSGTTNTVYFDGTMYHNLF